VKLRKAPYSLSQRACPKGKKNKKERGRGKREMISKRKENIKAHQSKGNKKKEKGNGEGGE